jgi:hypothetical protein
LFPVARTNGLPRLAPEAGLTFALPHLKILMLP